MSEPVNPLVPRVRLFFYHPSILPRSSNLLVAFFFSFQDEEVDPHFEPVIKLTEQVETKTHEEDEDVLFKMCVDSIIYSILICNQPRTDASFLGVQSSSDSTVRLPSGRNVERAMFACSLIRKIRKCDSLCDETRL